jgi:hypothetical protein
MIDTRDGTPQRPEFSHVYYKGGYQGIPSSSIKVIPPKLRMIAGSAKNTSVMARWDAHISYACNAGNWEHDNVIPNCGPGNELHMRIEFPQCWDGVNLDSADHKSHMAYGNGSSTCPTTHPIPLPEITMIVVYPIIGKDTSTWRLSSDHSGAPAGTSGHADWMNGWTGQTAGEYIPTVWTTKVINKGLSGGSHILGDGRVMQ